MATQITAATHQDSLSGSAERRLDVDPAGRLWLAVADTGAIRFLVSTDAGTTWAPSVGSDLAYGSGQQTAVPSFFIDADGYAHVSFVRWQATPQTVTYARGTPKTGGGWTWKTLTISPVGGRTGVDSDVIAFRTGTGWTAWVTWSLGSAGGSRVSRVTITASGALTVADVVHGPSGGDASWQLGSLTFEHTGDGRTQSSTPHVYLVTASQATSTLIRAHRATWSSGTWTWGTPVQLAAATTVPDTVLCSVHDGSRVFAAWATGGTAVLAAEWDGVAGSSTARNPPALPGGLGTVKGISLAVDPSTQSIYLVAYGATVGTVYLCVFTRSGTTWGAWTNVATRAANTQDGDVQLVRHPPGESVDLAYGVGNAPSITLWHARVATLVRAPAAPTLLYPPPGAQLPLADGDTFRWDHSELGPGDSQQSWQLRRSSGAGPTVEYWTAAALSWSTGAGGFSDAFTSQNVTDWTGWSGSVQHVSGRVRITPSSVGVYPPLYRTGAQSMAGVRMAVEVPVVLNVGNGTTGTYLYFETSPNNRVQIVLTNGNLIFREMVNSVDSDTTLAYNATDHRWWAIREAGGTVYWETSPDGTTWTTRRSKVGVLNLTSGRGFLSAGYSGTEPTPGVAEFDNYSESGAGTPVWNPSAAVNPEQAVFPAGKWTTGVAYSWSVRTKSAEGVESAWALDRTVTATVAPQIVITEPAGIVYDTSTPQVSWTYTSATPQRDYEVRIIDPSVAHDVNDPSPSLWTSGQVTSPSARTVRVGTPLADPNGTYRVFLRVHDSAGVASRWAYVDFSLSAQSPVGPSLTVVPHIPYRTGVPRARLVLTGRANYLSADQARSVAGWLADANAVIADVAENLLAQSLGGFSITSLAAGDMRAVTAPGDPPETPVGQPALAGPLDFPVVAGVDYTALASLRTAAAARAARVVIRWYSVDDGSGEASSASSGGVPGDSVPGTSVPGSGSTSWVPGSSVLLAESVGQQVVVDDTGYTQVAVQAMAPIGAVLARVVVEVLACAAASEVVSVARMSLAPGRALSWRPGGSADNQVVTVRRSDDGGFTWVDIATAKTDYWQQAALEDRTLPLGVEVRYQGTASVAGASGALITSLDSSIALTVVDTPAWAIRDPEVDEAEVLAYVTAHDYADSSDATVTYAAGRVHPVVDSEDAVRAGGGSMTLHVKRPYLDATVAVLTTTGVLIAQSPSGAVLWLHPLSRDYVSQWRLDRELTVEYVLAPVGG